MASIDTDDSPEAKHDPVQQQSRFHEQLVYGATSSYSSYWFLMMNSGAPPVPSADLEELRRTELEVIESIMADDFRVLQPTAWKGVTSSQVQTYEAILRPEIDSLKEHVSVVVRFALTRTYPNTHATCYVRAHDPQTRGVRDSDLKVLEEKMNQTARSLRGTEMIWELINVAQEFISTHNTAPADGAPAHLSLEERMRQREHVKEENEKIRSHKLQRQMDDEERQRSTELAIQIEQETHKQKQAIKTEAKKLRESPRFVIPSASERLSGEPVRERDELAFRVSMVPLHEPVHVNDTEITCVKRGPFISPISLARTYYCVPVTPPDMPDDVWWTLEIVPISSSYYTTNAGQRKLSELEMDLARLQKVHDPVLVPILGWNRWSHPDNDAHVLALYLVHDACGSSSVTSMLQQCGNIPWTSVQNILASILSALDKLHSQKMTHRGITLDTITLQNGQVRLSGAFYRQQLRDMHRSNALNTIGVSEKDMMDGWRSPESLQSPLAYTSSRDIWDLGRCTCQMLFGEHVVQQFISPEALFETRSFSSDDTSYLSLLKSMLHRVERHRGTARELLNNIKQWEELPSHPNDLVQTSYQDALTTSLILPRDHQLRNTVTSREQDTANARVGSFWQLRNLALPTFQPVSRYLSDFEEVEFLGKGAFGVVVKARNKLDERFYAVKKVHLSSSAAEEERTMREIMALSRLDHPHIVRYVTCWIERTETPAIPPSTIDSNERWRDSSALTTSQQLDTSALRQIHHLKMGKVDDFLSEDKDMDLMDDDFIQFGEGSWSEQDEDDSYPSEDSRLSVPASTTDQSMRVLYIQMEYVENQTLGDALEHGVSVDQAWHIFRQMLEALAHIASLGIIHRDLKPSNVLMDTHGDIKIGDFGLATTNLHAMEPGQRDSMAQGESKELTSGLGTFLYIAPEVLSKKGISARYNQKVDMFSLGIIFFEMLASQRCYKTTMERYKLLNDLRSPAIRFPASWDKTLFASQTQIIRQLLDHDPGQRPTPMAMLRSPLLPPKMEDEFVQELVRLAANPTSLHRHELIHALFSRPQNDKLRDYTFDTGAQGEEDDVLVGVVCRYLRDTFQCRGAVPVHPPLLFPPSDEYGEESNIVRLLDKTGNVVFLPFDLTVPFARICARSGHMRLKRFDIADVYRENLLAGGQPRAVLAASYDIISQEPDPSAEAEVLALMYELLQMPGLAGEAWNVELSHESILRVFLQRFPAQFHSALLEALPQYLARGSDARVRHLLGSAGMPVSLLDEVDAWNIYEDFDTAVHTLAELLTPEERTKLAEPLAHLVSVVRLAREFSVQSKIYLVPLFSHSHTHYRNGTMMAVSKMSSGGKHRDVLAVGGRYDELLRRFSYPRIGSSQEPRHGVGLQIAVGKMVKAVARYQQSHVPRFLGRPEQERTLGPWTPRRCECYIASSQPGLLESKIQICKTLWSNGISADLQYECAAGESPEVTVSTCRAEGILFLILLRAHTSAVKVKEVITRTEHEVAREGLTTFLQDRIARQRRVDQMTVGVRPRESDTQRLSTSLKGGSHSNIKYAPRINVQVFLPGRLDRSRRTERRLKSASRLALAEKAASDISRLLDAIHAGRVPVFAVELSSGLLERFAAVALETDEVFKTFIHDEIPSSDERDYVKALRSIILDTIDDDTPSNGPPSFGTSPTTSHSNISCQPSRVLIYSIKDGKTVLCG